MLLIQEDCEQLQQNQNYAPLEFLLPYVQYAHHQKRSNERGLEVKFLAFLILFLVRECMLYFHQILYMK